jgi:hypothetical protein
MYPLSTTFELHGDASDIEIMIRWGGLPAGTKAQLVFSQVTADAVIQKTAALFGQTQLTKIDNNTVELSPGAVSFLGLPGTPQPLAGLLRVLFRAPAAVIEGPTGASRSYPIKIHQITSDQSARRVSGGFTVQVTEPVDPVHATQTKRERITHDVNELARIRAVAKKLDFDPRLIPIVKEYTEDMQKKLSAFGVDHTQVLASFEGAHVPTIADPASVGGGAPLLRRYWWLLILLLLLIIWLLTR